MSAYAGPRYAEALAEWGTPVELGGSAGWLLEQPIEVSALHDARGCYPVFSCRDWQGLPADLKRLDEKLVSVTVVTDPLAEPDAELLRKAFPDVSRPYKQHFVVDLSAGASALSLHHRRNVKRALQHVELQVCAAPEQHLQEWLTLYAGLRERHQIRGIAAFSSESFRKQLQLPGLRMFRASIAGQTIGLNLWMAGEVNGYYHLGAYSAQGYRAGAAYALFWFAIGHFRQRGLKWLNLGAGAGAVESVDDGLSRFKRGWATGTKTAYLCGRICNRAAYLLLAARASSSPAFFPAYRQAHAQ